MPSRFLLPSSGTPGLSPALRIDWSHTPGTIVRLPMATSTSGTGFAATTYTPDGSDHIAAGTAHIAQFVSAPLAAQTIGVQTVSLTVLGLEANAGNNLFLHWTVYAVTPADGLVGTLVAARTDGTELNTTQQARTDSVSSTSVTVAAGDRLVFEIGVSGTPTATGGVQGHNATLRFGDNGSNLAANDTATTDGNPWLDFATTTIVFRPETTATVAPRGAAELANRGGQVSAGTASFTNLNGGTLTPALPTVWFPDDLFVLLFSHNANGALAAPSGWTQLYGQNNTTGQRTEVWTRRAQAGDTAPTLTLSTNTVTTLRGARIYRVAAVGAPTEPIDASSILTNAASATTLTFTDVTTTTANDFVLALGAFADSPTGVSTMSGWTERADAVATWELDPISDDTVVTVNDARILANGSSAAGMALIDEWRAVTTPGAAGATSVTVSGGTFGSAVSTGVVLAIRTNVAAGAATSATVAPRAEGSVRTTSAKASTTTVSLRGTARAATATAHAGSSTAVIRAPARVAIAATHAGSTTGALRAPARVATVAARAAAATAVLRGLSRQVVVSTHAGTATVVSRATARLLAAAARASTATATLRSAGRISAVGTHAGAGTAALRAEASVMAVQVEGSTATVTLGSVGRAAISAARSSAATAALAAGARASTVGSKGGIGTPAERGTGRIAAVGVHAGNTSVVSRGVGRLSVAGVRGAVSAVVARALGRSASAGTHASVAAVTVRGGARLVAVFVSVSGASLRAAGRLAGVGTHAGTTTVRLETTARATTSVTSAHAATAAIRSRAQISAVSIPTLAQPVVVRSAARMAVTTVRGAVSTATLAGAGRQAATTTKGGLTQQLAAVAVGRLASLATHAGTAIAATRSLVRALVTPAGSHVGSADIRAYGAATVAVALQVNPGTVVAGAAAIGGVTAGTAEIGSLLGGASIISGVSAGTATPEVVLAGTAGVGRVIAGAAPEH